MGAGLVICCSDLDTKYEDERDTEHQEQTNNDDNIIMKIPNIIHQQSILSNSSSQNTIIQ